MQACPVLLARLAWTKIITRAFYLGSNPSKHPSSIPPGSAKMHEGGGEYVIIQHVCIHLVNQKRPQKRSPLLLLILPKPELCSCDIKPCPACPGHSTVASNGGLQLFHHLSLLPKVFWKRAFRNSIPDNHHLTFHRVTPCSRIVLSGRCCLLNYS